MRWKPVGASAATTHPWSLARRTTAGDPDQVQADPTPPAEPPGVAPAPVPPLSPPPLTTARAAATSACRPAVAVRNGAMSGSARTTTTAVPHRGRLYAPDARHQPRRQSPGLEDVMVDSGMRSPEETWSGMSAKVRTWTWTWTWRSSTSARCVVYDGRPLNAAAGAVMRMRTWMQYGVNILVQRTWRNRGVATGTPWRRWTWRPWESVGEADGNLGRPRGRRSWSLRAADAAVWEDLKDIKPPMYDGNPLNLDRFLEKLDDWGLTVTEDLPPADAEKYVFKRFRYRLPEVLGELYFMATKEGKIKTLKEAKKWLNEQERVDAPQVAAKRWKSIKLEHDGREIRLREWRDFRGKYTLFRRNVEDWNEGDEQARLLSMLPEAWIKRVTKEESKRAKSNHTVKMMLPKEYHTNVVSWAKKNVARDVKRHSLRNALLITVSGDREKTAMWRLDDCELSGQTIRLQPIPARMSCDEILEWVGEEVLKEYRNLHHTRGLRPGDRDVNYVGEGPGGESAMDPAEPAAMRLSSTMTTTMSPPRWLFVPSWPRT